MTTKQKLEHARNLITEGQAIEKYGKAGPVEIAITREVAAAELDDHNVRNGLPIKPAKPAEASIFSAELDRIMNV